MEDQWVRRHRRQAKPSSLEALVRHHESAAVPVQKLAAVRSAAQSDIVLADETTLTIQCRAKRGYMWAFRNSKLIA